jgi:hypothetical protein
MTVTYGGRVWRVTIERKNWLWIERAGIGQWVHRSLVKS